MPRIIDAATDLTQFAQALRQADVATVIRYFKLPGANGPNPKCISNSEAKALAQAGLALATVFEQRGGAGGHIEDFTAATGARDAKRSLQLAAEIGQPEGSAIYFGVDWDFGTADLDLIGAYFDAVLTKVDGRYRVGVYGSGLVCGHLLDTKRADLAWLSGSMGWTKTHAFLASGRWSLFQSGMEKTWPGGGFGYDENTAASSHGDFGQFVPGGPVVQDAAPVGSAALYEVGARSGLNLRRGAGSSYDVITTLPFGTIVHVLGQQGEWVLVDRDGDGKSDGYCFGGYLQAVAGGLPLIANTALTTPYDVAKAELALDIREVPGNGNNPRIVMYHATTTLGSEDDSVAWCSSFVNYCVTQAGLIGTRNAWAMSWHDAGWGQDVSANPRDGDIVVFSRKEGGQIVGGHVGFYLGEFAGASHRMIRVLGGNQSNRVRISDYPDGGTLGGQVYKVLSIRRATS